MTTQEYHSGPTPNDLLERLIAKRAPAAPHLQIQAQGVDGAGDGLAVAPVAGGPLAELVRCNTPSASVPAR